MTFVYICVCLFPLVLHMASTEYMFAVERDKWMAAFRKQTFPNIWPQNWGNCWWSDRLWTWSTLIQPEGSHLETSPREDQKYINKAEKRNGPTGEFQKLGIMFTFFQLISKRVLGPLSKPHPALGGGPEWKGQPFTSTSNRGPWWWLRARPQNNHWLFLAQFSSHLRDDTPEAQRASGRTCGSPHLQGELDSLWW